MITWKRIGLENLTFPIAKDYNKEFLIYNEQLPKGVQLGKNRADLPKVINNLKAEEYQGLGKEFMSYIHDFSNSGITLHLPKDTKINSPIKIEFNMDNDNPIVIDHNIIVAESGSEVTIVIDYSSDSDVHGFHNGLTKVFAMENSVVNIIKLQRMNNKSQSFDSNVAYVERQAQVNLVSIELGSSISGSNFTTFLEGEASQGNLSSVYLGDGTRKMDLGYTMVHKGPRSLSNIETKGVLMDESRKVFRGNLDFKKGARRSKGVEGEYVILLDPTVKSDSIPGLFCEEDDVQGEHAASAGQIHKDKLFYLMSRGLSEREAKKLIVEASFRPVIDKIPLISLREEISAEIERRIVNA